jgi:hypothetical protein
VAKVFFPGFSSVSGISWINNFLSAVIGEICGLEIGGWLYLSEFPLPPRKPAMLTTFEVATTHA